MEIRNQGTELKVGLFHSKNILNSQVQNFHLIF